MKQIFFIFTLLLSLTSQASDVLFLGDSHSVGPFGRSFDQHLRSSGLKVNTFASCGSIAQWWKTGKKTPCGFFSKSEDGQVVDVKEHATPVLEELLRELRPRVVVVELGGNYVNVPSDDFARSDIDTLITSIVNSGAQCFWITNPDSRTNRAAIPRILKLIQEGVGQRCPIFESWQVTKYPESGGDGIHYWSSQGTPIAQSWAKAAYARFLEYFPL